MPTNRPHLPNPITDTDTPQDDEITGRHMPVNAEGHATGPTLITYASGRQRQHAYYAHCCSCPARHPFFSPADRDAWCEVHRTHHPDHAVQLTSGPWDFSTPPWVAADGLPLTAPRTLTGMSNADPFENTPPGFPSLNYDSATLMRITERRELLKRGCPRHPTAPNNANAFYKELIVGDAEGQVHIPTLATYKDGCMVKWRLDVEDEEPSYDNAPS